MSNWRVDAAWRDPLPPGEGSAAAETGNAGLKQRGEFARWRERPGVVYLAGGEALARQEVIAPGVGVPVAVDPNPDGTTIVACIYAHSVRDSPRRGNGSVDRVAEQRTRDHS